MHFCLYADVNNHLNRRVLSGLENFAKINIIYIYTNINIYVCLLFTHILIVKHHHRHHPHFKTCQNFLHTYLHSLVNIYVCFCFANKYKFYFMCKKISWSFHSFIYNIKTIIKTLTSTLLCKKKSKMKIKRILNKTKEMCKFSYL